MVDLLASMRDIVGARTPADVEVATLTAARSLLGADAAFWLDLVEGDLQMTALAGLARPEAHVFSIVPAGTGLSADVVEQDAPIAVQNYVADPRAISTFATLFRSEGIESVAGAPMRSPVGVAGVLYVLCRRRREFTEGELHLLVSIAGFARAMRSQLMERDSALAEAGHQRRRAEESERLRRAADCLTSALLRGHALATGLESVSDELGARLHVEGLPAGQPVARVDEEEPSPHRTSARIPGADLAVLIAEGTLPDGHLEMLARLIGLDFHRQRAQVETEIRLTDQFIHGLFTGDTEELERLWRRASLLGMNLAVPRAVVSLGRERPADRMLLDRIHREMRSRTIGGQVTTYNGDVVLLWPVPTPEAERKLRAHVDAIILACRPQRLMVGIGPICRSADDYPAAVREAMFARQVAAHSAADKRVGTVSELGMYRLFAHVGGMDALREAVHETLGPLLDVDARDGSDLVNTLRAFLERDRRMAETARVLHLHVNTLRYRIERIARLLSADLDDPEDRFFTLLALRLSNVVGSGGATATGPHER